MMERVNLQSLKKPGNLLLVALLLITPLSLSFAWGDYVSDLAYITLQAAQSFTNDLQMNLGQGLLTQRPIFMGILAAAGDYAPEIARTLSAFGWSATALVALLSIRAAGRPLAGAIASLLIVFNPVVVTTLGLETSWVLALGWGALGLTVIPPPTARSLVWVKVLLLFILLDLHFNAATILFALALLAIDVYRGRANWLPFTLVAAAALIWGLVIIPRFGAAPAADPGQWLDEGIALLDRRPLIWLFVPFVLAGLWDVATWDTSGRDDWQAAAAQGQQLFCLLILWAVAALLARSMLAPALLVVTALALASLGITWITRKITASGQFDHSRAAVLVPLLALTTLLLVTVVQLRMLFTERPVAMAQLQNNAAVWLADHAENGALLYASPRIGYLSGLATIPALADETQDSGVAAVYHRFFEQSPDYIILENSPAWDNITRPAWFKERYQEKAQFEDGYAANSPLTIWQYTPSSFDAGEQTSLREVVDNRFALVGYQFEPQVITPGDDVFVTLYLEALEPVKNGFITGVHLATPDGWVWAWAEESTPGAISGERWQEGLIIPERFRIATENDIPLSAYNLQVFWRDGDSKDRLPVVDDRDGHQADHVVLGTIIAPPPVDASQATPVNAHFGEAIVLDGYTTSTAVPGDPWDTTLYWRASGTPAADYTVFVHLLNGQGEIVAAHDGMPADNRFPTSAWRSGLLIEDRHQLLLPAELPPGQYQLNVGLYLLETGERLNILDAGGIEQPDRSLPLTVLTVESQQQ